MFREEIEIYQLLSETCRNFMEKRKNLNLSYKYTGLSKKKQPFTFDILTTQIFNSAPQFGRCILAIDVGSLICNI